MGVALLLPSKLSFVVGLAFLRVQQSVLVSVLRLCCSLHSDVCTVCMLYATTVLTRSFHPMSVRIQISTSTGSSPRISSFKVTKIDQRKALPTYNSKNNTPVAMVSTAGGTMRPMFTCKGQRLQLKRIAAPGPEGSGHSDTRPGAAIRFS